MTKSQQQAAQFLETAKRYGWNVERATGNVVTITKRFTPGDNEGLVECDMEYYSILSHAPLKGGSIWGTDCGGIGALSALKSGVFRINKSGNGKRFLDALSKMI